MSESIPYIINEIHEVDPHGTGKYEKNSAKILPVLVQLPRLPDDLRLYLDSCIPIESYGRWVEFSDAEGFLLYHTRGVPGSDAILQGFLCFAKDADGTQFAYCTETERIFHLHFEIGETSQETRDTALNCWPSLQEFLSQYLSEIIDFMKEDEGDWL